jgi:hypothetical protein
MCLMLRELPQLLLRMRMLKLLQLLDSIPLLSLLPKPEVILVLRVHLSSHHC